jgi:hypothetical protein
MSEILEHSRNILGRNEDFLEIGGRFHKSHRERERKRMNILTLISKDGVSFNLTKDCAQLSRLILTMLDGTVRLDDVFSIHVTN